MWVWHEGMAARNILRLTGHGLHTTITVWFLAILAKSLVVILLDFFDHLVGSPEAVRNCLTVDALIPKFTFSGSNHCVDVMPPSAIWGRSLL